MENNKAQKPTATTATNKKQSQAKANTASLETQNTTQPVATNQTAAITQATAEPAIEQQPAAKPAAWANPTPAGLVALAVACFGFCAVLCGHVEASAMPLLGAFLLGGFVIQIIVAMLDLKGGNSAGGNTFMYFSAFFMLASGIEMFIKYYCGPVDARIDGWVWIALSLVVLLWTPAFFKSPAILFIIVAVLNIACPCIALADIGSRAFSAGAVTILKNIAGYSLLTCGILAIYLSAAMILNGTYGKTILPNPAPFYKEKK